jgi:hypothetical protein
MGLCFSLFREVTGLAGVTGVSDETLRAKKQNEY